MGTTKSSGEKAINKIDNALNVLSEKAHMGKPAIVTIIIGVLLVFLLIMYCICKRCICRRKKGGKDGKKGKGAVDMKSVQLLGNEYKEKVQPDMEELVETMEDNEGNQEKEVEKLGKLQYSLDYDFQKGELSVGVIQASDLPAMDMGGTSDPYVKVYIMPEKKKKFETKCIGRLSTRCSTRPSSLRCRTPTCPRRLLYSPSTISIASRSTTKLV
ncbi:hypothetical protein BOX15_Mlig032421g1 [Macrostomum lignano]|uniref:C2 domain-containing protein n=1 Tax=Macrostomum lignano TaxID=282301 RepID=A0A267DBS0_9PLAT|nr:hypothetical protein BOX15_Mlig032421g1 [Macrostomum lignano]